MEPFDIKAPGTQLHQIKGLSEFIYYTAVHLHALESLVRTRFSEEEYRKAVEQARQSFPSESTFADAKLREYLQRIARTNPSPEAKPE